MFNESGKWLHLAFPLSQGHLIILQQTDIMSLQSVSQYSAKTLVDFGFLLKSKLVNQSKSYIYMCVCIYTVHQSGFSKETEPIGYRENIYYKELFCANMEAEKAQDLESRNWRPRGADGRSFSSKANRLQTQEELMFQFKSKGWKRSLSRPCSGTGRVPSYQRVSLFILLN